MDDEPSFGAVPVRICPVCVCVCVCVCILRHTTIILVPLVAGIDRNVGEMSEPFHMNDIGRKREREGREERKEEFFNRPHNHNHKYRVRHWCRWMNWIIRQGSEWLQGPQGNNIFIQLE